MSLFLFVPFILPPWFESVQSDVPLFLPMTIFTLSFCVYLFVLPSFCCGVPTVRFYCDLYRRPSNFLVSFLIFVPRRWSVGLFLTSSVVISITLAPCAPFSAIPLSL